MSTKKRRKYSRDFKREAVGLITEQGYSIAEAARNLDIHPITLGRWKQEFSKNGNQAFHGTGQMTPEQAEINRLLKENKRLKMERDILKKAAAFFAREPD